MSVLLENCKLQINRRTDRKLPPSKIKKFLNLSKVTSASINGEIQACKKEPSYSQVVAPWIPVKCYYRLYYLEAVLIYLLCSSEAGFGRVGHTAVRNELICAIKDAKIIIANKELAKIVTWEEADSFKARRGATIATNYYLDENCPKSIRGKLAEYSCISWLDGKPFDNFLTKVAQTAKKNELLPSEICILDFFYLMRLKANYRDVDFLDFESSINEMDALRYVESYVEATEKYADGLKKTIAAILKARNMLPLA